MPSKSFLAAAILILLAGSVGTAAETMTLIGPDQPAPVIVVGAAAVESEKYAAEEMSTYLEKMTGRKVEVVDDRRELSGNPRVIAIGKSKLTASLDIAGLDVEQYLIDVQPNRLVIIGGRRPAADYAHHRRSHEELSRARHPGDLLAVGYFVGARGAGLLYVHPVDLESGS
jgi:hypothetical protein